MSFVFIHEKEKFSEKINLIAISYSIGWNLYSNWDIRTKGISYIDGYCPCGCGAECRRYSNGSIEIKPSINKCKLKLGENKYGN